MACYTATFTFKHQDGSSCGKFQHSDMDTHALYYDGINSNRATKRHQFERRTARNHRRIISRYSDSVVYFVHVTRRKLAKPRCEKRPRGLVGGMERGEKGAPLIVPKVGHRSNTVMAVTKLYIRKRSQLNY